MLGGGKHTRVHLCETAKGSSAVTASRFAADYCGAEGIIWADGNVVYSDCSFSYMTDCQLLSSLYLHESNINKKHKQMLPMGLSLN